QKMKNKSLTPQIRFKGYEDEWVSRPFSEIVTRYSLLKYDETIPSVEYEDINSKKGTLNKDIFSKPIHKSGQYFQIGDILFGKLRPYLGNNLLANFDGIAVGDFWIFKNGLANTRFIYPFLYSKDYSYISNISSGSKMPRSDWGLVSSWNFNIPSSEEEQTLIGGLFANIDKSIFEAEREITRLEKMKQASLQKMFPRPGETTPEIRFDGFDGEWRRCKLSELLTQRIEHQKISEDEPLLAFSYAEGVIDPEDKKSNKRDFLMTDKFNKIFSRTEVDDIIYNPANVIHGAIHRNTLKTGVVSPIYKIFSCSYNISPKYMGVRLRTPHFIAEILKYIEGTVIKLRTLSPESFLNMEIEIPNSLSEQECIGEYFVSLDAIISAKRKKLDKLQNLKQSCLDKMFVNTTAQ
ncbi:restriction endonuclease subunit S, partial [uncultured Duncaniella sp.]|uniref:restriction endonuclease subunit S n=1 Tax=uncultured Duncaniella sp. TaxID=2768039 RepID=UPI0025B710E5